MKVMFIRNLEFGDLESDQFKLTVADFRFKSKSFAKGLGKKTNETRILAVGR